MARRERIGIRELKSGVSEVIGEVRERGREYVVTKRGEPVAVLRPWSNEDAEEERALAVSVILEQIEESSGRIAAAAGRRSARAAVDRQRR